MISEQELRGDEVVIEGPTYRHLFRARRLAEDAVIRLVDGAGAARFGRSHSISASSARFVLGEDAPANETMRYVELLVPVPKSSRLSWMVEKATEIGVGAIRLIHSERAPRELGLGGLERLSRVAVAAVEQSQRSVVPAISGVHLFSEIPHLLSSIPARWFLQTGTELLDGSRPDNGRRALLVGPEGGWTTAEAAQLSDWGCVPAGLGPTVLRVETAATVGCARLLLTPPPQ